MKLIAAFAFVLALSAGSAHAGTLGNGPLRLKCSSSAPTPTGNIRLWIKCSNGHLMRTDGSNIDHDIETGGVPDLQAVIDAGGVYDFGITGNVFDLRNGDPSTHTFMVDTSAVSSLAAWDIQDGVGLSLAQFQWQMLTNSLATSSVRVQNGPLFVTNAYAWNTVTPGNEQWNWWLEAQGVSGSSTSSNLLIGRTSPASIDAVELTISSTGAVTATGGIITPTIGANFFSQHSPPSGTGALVSTDATQSLSAKTLTSPVISTGLTASGSAVNDFSGSTGAVKATAFAGGGPAPTLSSVNANAGAGATASVVGGTDTAFEVQIVSGTSAAAGTWATFNFAATKSTKPYCIPRGDNAVSAGNAAASGYAVYVDRSASSTSQVVIGMGTAAGSSSTTFNFVVHCIQ